MPQIARITLFKIPNEEIRNNALKAANEVPEKARKDGKPYITSMAASIPIPDPRNQGFNMVIKSSFASIEDMQFYDTQCEAHRAVKAVVGPAKEDILTVFYEGA